MQFSIFIFEFLMATLLIICILHASKRGKQYIIEILVAGVYGVLLEILTMIQLEFYTYGDFFVELYGAPIAIGIGWAVIIYTAMATSDKLGLPVKIRPFMAALLALNIDLSMDAIAIREGFWTWGEYGLWFGVPLGNFFGWFVVVSSYSYFIYRFRGGLKFQTFYPVTAMILSLIVLLVLDGIWFFCLTLPAHIVILVIILSFSAGYIFVNKGTFKKDNEFEWKIFSVPLVFHVFFLALLLIREYRIAALVLISSSMLIAGLFVHLLPSLEILRK
jgi:uncharacterized membrane protein